MSTSSVLGQPARSTTLHQQEVKTQNRVGRQGDSGKAIRSGERITGNALVALGIGFLLLLGAAYGYMSLEEWLNAQQRYVVVSMIDDAQLIPLIPPLSSTLPGSGPIPTLAASDTASSTLSPAKSGETKRIGTAPAQAPQSAVAVPVRIVIPKINVNSRIVETVPKGDGNWGTAAYAVGYHKGTGLIGEADNIILSGHNNYQGEVFRRLSELRVGDGIKLYSADREYRYIVKETATIPWVGASAEDRRRHIQYLLPTSEPTLTLVSCWPYWVYTHRVYVVAKPAP